MDQETADMKERCEKLELALQESNNLLEETIAELKRTQLHIIQRERLHAFGSMAKGIAHDINNSLSPILGFTDLLLESPEKLKDEEKVHRYLEMIRSSANKAANVVSRLRSFYRPRTFRSVIKTFDLNALIENTIDLTKPQWHDLALSRGADVKIETDFQSEAFFSGSVGEIQEAFTNLILNAVDAIEEKGTIRITTATHDKYILAKVEDDGEGMSEQTLRKCVDPFFSTRGQRASGFGLPTVYGITDRHGGALEVSSKQGEGTTVSLYLPIGTPPRSDADRTDLPDALATRISKPPLKVLVADDEALMRELIETCLTGDGHTVEVAEDGSQAWEKFQNGKFDLVVTDRAMPNMNGDQLAQKVKEISPEIGVILLTGFGEFMKVEDDRPEGVDMIVNKPFTIESLRGVIDEVVIRSQHTS